MIQIVYDNVPGEKGFLCDWGFSCVVEVGGMRLLFDTGAKEEVLLKNLARAGFSKDDFSCVFFSHSHWDHTGGMGVVEGLKKYALSPFGEMFHGKVMCLDEGGEFLEGFFSTGSMGKGIVEQGLFVKDYGALITGCAHPGIVDMVRKAKQWGNIDIVIGGFHLLNSSEEDVYHIVSALRNLGVKRVAPSHCTGKHAIEIFNQVYGEGFVRSGVGCRVL